MSLPSRRALVFWLPLATAGLVGLAGALISWPLFLRGWLTAVLTMAALPLGSLPILMTYGLTGGRWGDQSLLVWRALISTLPLWVIAMVPLLFGLEELFRWAQPEDTLPEVVRNKRLYLNEPFFIGRAILYAALWLWLAAVLYRRAHTRLHGPGLLLWLVSMTFFSVDWFMSLEPTFYSDIFGLILATGAVAATMAAAFLLGAGKESPSAMRDLIGLWLAVVIGWVFLAFSQYIIIWHGNLPHEINWYLHRGEGHWRTLSWVSFLLFCIGPVLALISGTGRRRLLMAAAVIGFTGYVLRVQWLVLPAFPETGPGLYGFTLVATGALGAALAGVAVTSLKRLEAHNA